MAFNYNSVIGVPSFLASNSQSLSPSSAENMSPFEEDLVAASLWTCLVVPDVSVEKAAPLICGVICHIVPIMKDSCHSKYILHTTVFFFVFYILWGTSDVFGQMGLVA